MSSVPGPDSSSSAGVAAAALPALVQDVLSSAIFERAPTLRALLLYLWNQRDAPISEYAVATEALGRDSHFNPKIDATVRVQISRLRQRLEKYYEEEGRAATDRLFIPLGSHQVEVRQHTSVELVPVLPVIEKPRVRGMAYWFIWISVILTIASSLWTIRVLKTEQPAHPLASKFWLSFFANHRPTRIVLPTPVFFSWRYKGPTQTSLMFRDTDINQYEAGSNSPTLADLKAKHGEPSLSQSYTVTSDTFASVRLARYLDHFGLDTTVMSSASAPLEALDRENVIALGTWGTLMPLKLYLDRMSFELGKHETIVANRTPANGEAAQFLYKQFSQERSSWPGVIAVLPGRDNKTHLLILAGRHTSALVSFLTSQEGQDQLTRFWSAQHSPEFFEVVVEAEMNSEVLVRFNARALHAIRP